MRQIYLAFGIGWFMFLCGLAIGLHDTETNARLYRTERGQFLTYVRCVHRPGCCDPRTVLPRAETYPDDRDASWFEAMK